MKPTPRIALLIAGLALPITAVASGYLLDETPGTPRAPAEVRVGGSRSPLPAPGGQVRPTYSTTATEPPTALPPPPPDDDGDDDEGDTGGDDGGLPDDG